MSDDVALLAAWRAGDKQAGSRLFARHIQAILRFFRTKLGDDVEDLVQRTFLDCVESRDQVRENNFRAYLFGVARHRLVDHLRQKMRRDDKTEVLLTSVADLKTTPSQLVARNQSDELLLQALRAIPLDYQIAMELTYWEDLSSHEIAHVLEIPAATVRSRLNRGRQLLRQHIARLAKSPALAASTWRALAGK